MPEEMKDLLETISGELKFYKTYYDVISKSEKLPEKDKTDIEKYVEFLSGYTKEGKKRN